MKKTKMLWAIIVAMLLISSNIITIFAQPDLSGRDPTAPVTLTVHHRTMPDGVIDPGNPANPGFPNPIGVPIVGSQWQIQQVNLPSGFDFNNPDAVASIPPDWLVGPTFPSASNASGEVLFSDMNQGVFLVRELESAVTSLAELHRPFLVDLPLFFNNEWVYDVHVYIKQETESPPFDKEVADLDGHIISWAFSVEILAGLGTLLPIQNSTPVTFLSIVDVLDPRLTFVTGSIEVSYETEPGVFETVPDGIHWTGGLGAGNTLTVNILEDGRNMIAADGLAGGSIRVQFDTSIEGIPIDYLGEIENTGTLYYGTRAAHEFGSMPGEVPPTATAFGFELTKVNTSNTVLPGAIFHLFRQSDVEEYESALRPRTGATPLAILESDDSGFAYIYGLTQGTYLLVEVQAPTGYNPFTNPITLEVGPTTANDEFIVVATITNSSDFELPLTGGAGTLLFTIIGLSLIGGSVLFVIMYARSRKKQEELS